jgi:two-component system, NtrC family, sensor kinase
MIPQNPNASSSAIPSVNRRVLIVDDNTIIQADYQKILSPPDAGDRLERMDEELFGQTSTPKVPTFETSFASQGEAAASMVSESIEHDRPYALAFVDVRMPPGIDGIQTIEKLWRIDSRLHVVICSAYSDYGWSDIQARFGVTDKLLILKKPFDMTEVLQMAHALTMKWTLHELERRRREEAQQRIDQLSVLLPVCMHCGQIRSDESWMKVDAYLKEGGAELTHSICPPCLERFHPE